MEFDEYQAKAQETDQVPQQEDDGLVVPLLGMIGEAASLQTEYKKLLRDGSGHLFFEDHIREELGDILWYVANLAWKLDISLDDVATSNLQKTRGRWLEPDLDAAELLDEAFPESERFPREFVAEIREDSTDPTRNAVLTINGMVVGDRLDDNSYEEDGYKFHDVFHLAHMTCLGWSPVMRKLLGRKRKSDPTVDNVEDGGRAIVIDEAIVAFVFDYARRHDFLEGLHRVDYQLLRIINELTSRLEVRVRSSSEWERAILRGYDVWRHIRENKGGAIRCDLVGGVFELA